MNILDIYFSPTKFFIRLKEKPQWLIPLILIILTAIILSVVVLSSYSPEERIRQLRERNLSPEQIERAQQFIAGPLPWVSGIVAAIIFTPAALLLIALILNFFISLLGSSGIFITTFCCVVGAALVRIPGMIVKVILILAKGTPFVHTSFVVFTPMLSKDTYLFRLLSKLDFFTIWEVILIALGLQTIYSLKGKQSYYLVIGIWLLYIIIIALFAGRLK